jgi:porin
MSHPCGDCFCRARMLLLLALTLGVGMTVAAGAQTRPPPSAVRCPSPANPRTLYFECVGRPFDALEETLTKDWAGVRTALRRLGITPTASYTTQLLGNPSGGQSQGVTYSGTVQTAINWDLDTLLHIPGLLFNVGAAWSTGKNLSANAIGNSFTVQSAYTVPGGGTNTLTLGEMYVQQQLWHNALLIAAGRLVPETAFATMPVLNQYVNAGINPAPGVLGINDATFTGYPPGVEWGVQALYTLTPRWQLAAGVFNTNQSAARGGQGGLNFALQQGNRGVLSVVQVTYLANHAPEDRGMPGQFTFGGFYDSNRFSSLSQPNTTESGTYSLYGLFQQMVYRAGGVSSQQGLTVWGETAIAPKSRVNPMPYFLGAGVSYQGLVPGRGSDIASAGIIYGAFSHAIPRATAETVLEANYQITVTRWLSITSDLQYIIRPSGSSAISNALVLGVQLAMNL